MFYEDIDWKEVAMEEICHQPLTSLVERVHDNLMALQQHGHDMRPKGFQRLCQGELDLLIRIMSEIQNRLRKMEEISRRGQTSTESAPLPKKDEEEAASDSDDD